MKPRFAVDLDEVERQLNLAVPARPAPAPTAAPARAPSAVRPPVAPVPGSGRGDPLAELARIVGQDDPFGSLLANDKPARPVAQTPRGFDDIFAPRPNQVRPAAPTPAYPEPYRSAEPAPAYPESYRPAEPAQDYAEPFAYRPAAEPRMATAEEPAVAARHEPDDGYAPAYDQTYYSDENDGQGEEDYQPAERRSRKGLIAVASVLGAAVLGAGAALMLGGKGMPMGGEPPLVRASVEPTKVQPQSPGGVEIPNQNKQIYERAGNEGKTNVVDREEQPIDVRQAARGLPSSPDSTATTAPAPQPTSSISGLGEPRRVRTVTIRPDGTVVPDPGAPRAAAPAPSQVASAAPVVPETPAVQRSPVASAAPATPTTPVAPRPAASTPAASTPSSTSGASPQAIATPTPSQPAQATPQRLASVAPAAPVAAPASVAAAPAAEGGYAVQLAVRPSEGEARTAFTQLQQKYADLNGRAPMIRKAEVNGNTIYRVRVGPLAREDASSLCTKLQGAGGQCFVAKN